MTDTTTADKIAAGELIQKCELMVWFHHAAWACESTSLEYAGDRQYGPTWTAAVRAWAEAAGVPWNPPKVVPMWAVFRGDNVVLTTQSEDIVRALFGDEVVPCDVVIREPEGV